MTGTRNRTTRYTADETVAIIGGGLAGMAAAVALTEHGYHVELFESRRRLGGRATSFEDAETGEEIDHCQHVAMGCCTNFIDFCHRTGCSHLLRRDTRLDFFGPSGDQCRFSGSRWLPAPLHLAPALLRLRYLSLSERLGIGCTLLRLARLVPGEQHAKLTVAEWLSQQRQTDRSIRCFWEVVLVSALAESLDRASLLAARKVFVDGFLRSRKAYHVLIPMVPLQELYDAIARWLSDHGTNIHIGARVATVRQLADCGSSLVLRDGRESTFDFAIVALPWRTAQPVLSAALPHVARQAAGIESSPITSLHLLFDRPLTSLPHAVLVDRLSQWIFARPAGAIDDGALFPYQVVISASHRLKRRPRHEVLEEVLEDLHCAFPAAAGAQLVRWRMVTQPDAVFSVTPAFESQRPAQRTALPRVMLAGDWTQTGWPATMEGAVRSGYLAAEAILAACGAKTSLVVADLPAGWFAKWLGVA